MSSQDHPFRIRAVTALIAAGGLVATGLAAAAHAAPPVNDAPSGALVIPAVPAVLEADTREATSEAVERSCVYGRSVWYRYTPTETAELRISTVGSSYDTVLAVYSGARSPQKRIACDDDSARLQSAVRPRLVAGQRYWIAASRCCSRTRPGGDLDLRLSPGTEPAEVTAAVTGATAGSVSGSLRVTGTVECATASVVDVSLTVRQRVDEAIASGWGYRFLRLCTTEARTWTARIDSDTGWAFRPGLAAVQVAARARDGFASDRHVLETIQQVTDDPLGRRTAS